MIRWIRPVSPESERQHQKAVFCEYLSLILPIGLIEAPTMGEHYPARTIAIPFCLISVCPSVEREWMICCGEADPIEQAKHSTPTENLRPNNCAVTWPVRSRSLALCTSPPIQILAGVILEMPPGQLKFLTVGASCYG